MRLLLFLVGFGLGLGVFYLWGELELLLLEVFDTSGLLFMFVFGVFGQEDADGVEAVGDGCGAPVVDGFE